MKFDFDKCIKDGVEQAMKECELTIGMTLKEAVEKQIPKKPIEKEFVEDVNLNYCPCCNVRFIGWGMKFCGECGQALDWSDTE